YSFPHMIDPIVFEHITVLSRNDIVYAIIGMHIIHVFVHGMSSVMQVGNSIYTIFTTVAKKICSKHPKYH
ncbi:DUF436 family protein, partial [Staphylococcus aureus]